VDGLIICFEGVVCADEVEEIGLEGDVTVEVEVLIVGYVGQLHTIGLFIS